MKVTKEVRKAQKGQATAFEKLIREHQLIMYRVAKTKLFKEEDCADAIQEAILKAFRSIESLREPKYFKTWLLRIVMNECYAILRKKQKIIDIDTYHEPYTEEQGFKEVEVKDMLEQLSPEYSEVLKLYYLDDLTMKDIAIILDISENTVKTRVRRARQQAHSIISKGEEDAGWNSGKKS